MQHRSLGRVRRISGAGLALLAFVLAVVASVAAVEEVKVGHQPTITTAPVYIAVENRYFAEEGLNVQVTAFASSGKQMPALATGLLDVGTGAPGAALFNAIAQGMDFKVVADKGQIRPGMSAGGLMVRQDLWDSGEVRSPKDMVGRRILSYAPGIQIDILIIETLKKYGAQWKPENRIYMPPPKIISAFQTKVVDIATAVEPWITRTQRAGLGKILISYEDLELTRDAQIGVTIYSGAFSRTRKEAAKKFMKAYVKGVRFYTEHGLKNPEVTKILTKHTKVPVEDIAATIPFYLDKDGRPNVSSIMRFQDWFFDNGYTKKKVPQEQIIDLSFLN
ncbi:MAG: ABC transporter substrate-binding protein [Candidatus Tectomicrobia bacterium]|nr:ABC transporter substrate-binding protein [Candidatus Tectomicrobia bacterium]